MFAFLLSRIFLKNLAIAVLVVCCFAAGAYFYLLSYTRAGEAIEVPDLTGLDIVESGSLLKNLGLEIMVVDSIYLHKKKGGETLSQEPTSGSTVKKGRKIFLTVTRYSPPMVSLPNVIDQGLSAAIARLKSYGFVVDDMIPESNECIDCVIAVQYRGARKTPGTKLPKGARIDLVVGAGQGGEPVVTPDLIGLTLPDVILKLQEHALSLGASPFDSEDSTASRAYFQSAKSGDMIPRGSAIDVYFTSDMEKVIKGQTDTTQSQIQ